MARRVFLSYQHRDHGRARGFDLVRHAPNLNLAYSVRHLLQAADSTNEAYIGTRIRSQMKGTSVTVVLIGANTADSDWVAKEIEWSRSKEKPNGLLGIVIDEGAEIPRALVEYGAEVIDWNKPSDVQQFDAAIDRAALRAERGPAIGASQGSSSNCAR